MVADRLDHLEFDAGPGTPAAEDFHIALPIMAEREVRSLNHAPRGELATDHPVEELAGGQVEQPTTRPEDGDFGRPGFLKEGDFSLGQYQGDGSLVGTQQCHRVRVERDGQRRDARRVGPGAQPADQALMAAMNSVEVADRYIGPTGPRREVLDILDRDHRHPSCPEGPSSETAGLPLIDPMKV